MWSGELEETDFQLDLLCIFNDCREEELVKRRTEKKSCTKGRREEQEWTAAARELRGRRETKEKVESVG